MLLFYYTPVSGILFVFLFLKQKINPFVICYMQLIEFTDKGFYCSQGDFYIDPWAAVDYAIITHAHSDHARWGSKHYLCHHQCRPLLQLRLGDNHYESLEWGETITRNGVRISLHPAGHIIGSSQVRLEYKGEVWVASGDYKTVDDGISGSFEAVKCNVFITECTFGLPIYHWKPQVIIYKEIQDWIQRNQAEEKTSVLIAYSLGKAQRVLTAAAGVSNNIFGHGAICNAQDVLQANGWQFPEVKRITADTSREALKAGVVIAPPSADGTPWMKRFQPYNVGLCSGWMQVRGNFRRNNVDAGFVLSDHADWKGLLEAVKATGAEKVFTTHGFQSAFSRYLNENGIEAAEVKTAFGNDEETVAIDEKDIIKDIEV